VNFGVLAVKMAEGVMEEGENERRVRPSGSALSVNCLWAGVRQKEKKYLINSGM